MPAAGVRSGDDFLRLSKKLKAAGAVGLRRELHTSLRKAAQPLAKEAKQSAATRLPQRGGLAKLVAGRGARVRVATGVHPGVSIVFNKTDPRYDQGRIAHPVFGRRPMVTQSIEPGFFSEPMKKSAPKVRFALESAIIAVEMRVVR